MSFARTIRRKASGLARSVFMPAAPLDDIAFLSGEAAARQVRGLGRLNDLCDAEFRVTSQWGEDGIIEWLVHHMNGIPDSFVEFGVENYRESNTRFLLQHRNWRGLVIDGSSEHVGFIRRDRISWRHDLTAVAAFITRKNIDGLIADAGFGGELGILSVDIDGADYWVWEAISCVKPWLVIVEYNSAFGDLLPLSVPYDAGFVRTRAHYSNLYYGLSIGAARHLATVRGYLLAGTNRAGSNAFFVRRDVADLILPRLDSVTDRPSRFREGRAADGGLALTAPAARSAVIADLPVVNVATDVTARLGDLGELFSPRWLAHLTGQTRIP